MALNYGTNPTFTGRITAPDANYPYGSSKDESAPGANDGMPHIKQRADDILGFQQALLTEASITPNGSADTAVVSQYLEAAKRVLKSGRKNHIINGNFDVWQRGGSFTITTHLQRLCDRWNFDWNGTIGTVDVTQVDLGVSNTLPNFPKYVTRINQSTPSVGATFIDFSTQLEDVNTLNGRKVTISGWVNGTIGREILVKTEQFFGSGGSPSASEFNTSDPIILTGNWQKFEVTFDLQDTSSKTLGTDNNDTLNVILTLPLNVTSDLFFSGIQLEEGSIATDFEQVDEATEFMRCSRYLRPLPIGNTAAATTTTDVIHEIPLSPPMRVAPSLIPGSGNTQVFALAGFNSTATPVLGASSPNGVTVNQAGFSGLTAGFPYAVTAQPTAQPHLLSAE